MAASAVNSLGTRTCVVRKQGTILRLPVPDLSMSAGSNTISTSVAELCHFDTVLVLTSYLPFYGSGSGSGSLNN
jgi:hypothetical protein